MHPKLAPNDKIYLNIGCGTQYSPDWNNLDLNPQPGVMAPDVVKSLPYDPNSCDAQFACPRTPGPAPILDYQWTVLQLVDQQVREETGGETLKALRSGNFNPEFVRSRCGDEFSTYLDRNESADTPTAIALIKSYLRPLKKTLRKALKLEVPTRTSGEVHRWMYDRVSLRLLVTRLGFTGFKVVDHLESNIPDWGKYRLDTSLQGDYPRKPDSIFVEASKPA